MTPPPPQAEVPHAGHSGLIQVSMQPVVCRPERMFHIPWNTSRVKRVLNRGQVGDEFSIEDCAQLDTFCGGGALGMAVTLPRVV